MKLSDALKAVETCQSALALDALKGAIDRRITEIEQKGLKTEQKPRKSGQTPRKSERGGRPDGSLSPLNFLDVILRDAKEPFTNKDVSDILYNHYKRTLNHEIGRGSAESYAYTCIKRMLSKNMIEEAGKQKHEGIGRCATLYKKKPKKIAPEGAKDGIYEAADDGKKRLREDLGLERELCDSGHFEDVPEVTDGGA